MASPSSSGAGLIHASVCTVLLLLLQTLSDGKPIIIGGRPDPCIRVHRAAAAVAAAAAADAVRWQAHHH
jgi:hypothetical protein